MGTPAVVAYADAIAHLPAGAVLVLSGVHWDEYERLLEELADRPGVRISYDDGTLQVMSPSAEHEEYKELVLHLARACADELGLPLETRGSTTWKRRGIRKGVEPDTCFYVARAPEIIGKRAIDLETDPPPDIAVEIDVSNESLAKLPAYAALGVPEIWRCDGRRFVMYELVGREYRESRGSLFLPGVTPLLLAMALEIGRTKGQTEAIRLFRERIRAPR
jgi:Uma2 family endonuclease